MALETSPLTGIEVECVRIPASGTSEYSDPVCGSYAVADSLGLDRLSQEDKRKLAKVLATRTLRVGGGTIRLTPRDSGKHGEWECVTIDSLLAQYPKDVISLIDEALLNLSRLTEFPGDKIFIGDRERWLIFAHDWLSEDYMLRQLQDNEFIKYAGNRAGGTRMIQCYTIEVKGWARIRELREDSSQTDQVFVAMWFADDVQCLFDEAIVPAITEAGFRPLRIDLKEHNNKICDEIIAEIRRSRFVVADFTGNRGGVYYEAGFAHGLGKQVIWTVREDHLSGVHFDTRQYNHITYKTPEELRERLLNRIRATQ